MESVIPPSSITLKTTKSTDTGVPNGSTVNPEKEVYASKKDVADKEESEGDEEERPVSAEELIELKDDLIKAFDNPKDKDEHKTLSILKILQKTQITVPLLRQTMIGKTLSKIL